MADNQDLTLIGYARVSTADQSVQMQIDALMAAGIAKENIFSENMSGIKKNRPELANALRMLREGDTLVVWKLDRIARSIAHLIEVMDELEKKGVAFRSLTEGLETKTPAGKMIFHVIGAMAQLERDLIVERTRAGVKAAQARGVKFGAKHVIDPKDMPEIWEQVNQKGITKVAIAKKYKVTVQTISRRLKEYEAEQANKNT